MRATLRGASGSQQDLIKPWQEGNRVASITCVAKSIGKEEIAVSLGTRQEGDQGRVFDTRNLELKLANQYKEESGGRTKDDAKKSIVSTNYTTAVVRKE